MSLPHPSVSNLPLPAHFSEDVGVTVELSILGTAAALTCTA